MNYAHEQRTYKTNILYVHIKRLKIVLEYCHVLSYNGKYRKRVESG